MIGSIVGRYKEDIHTLTIDSLSIEGNQHDTLLNFNIKQIFVNNLDVPVEIAYWFPNDKHISTYDITFLINGREIKPKLRNKEKVQRKYKEAVEYRDLSLLVIGTGIEMCCFYIGNLEKKQKCEVHLKICFLADIDSQGIFYKFPLMVNYQCGRVSKEFNQNSIHARLKMFSSREMTNFEVSMKGQTKLIDAHHATFETNQYNNEGGIIVRANIKDSDKNVAVYNNGYTVVTTNPVFDAKIETNSEFYFIIDCSGSMYGSYIMKAREAMKLFLLSLPEGCRFSIYKFGDLYQSVLDPCDYSNENLRKAINIINHIDADMGGTDILLPLRHISSLKPKNGYIKQIFILTDGEVDNPDDVIACAQNNSSENRIFSLRLGSDADPGLIKGLAKKSGGSYAYINDAIDLNDHVIELLTAAISPAISNVVIEAPNVTEAWPSTIPPLFANTSSHCILKSDKTDNILISGNCCDDNINILVPVSSTPPEFENCLQYLFSHYAVDELETKYFSNYDEEIKEKCIQLSISSNTLCRFTSYVGVDFESSFHHESTRYDCCIGEENECDFSSDSVEFDSCIHEEISEEFRRMEEFEIIELYDLPDEMSQSQQIAVDSKDNSMIYKQNIDGSWDEFGGIDIDNVKKFGKKIAATIAAIIHIKTSYHDKLGQFSLIIRKALKFLEKQNDNDLSEIILQLRNDLKIWN